MNPQFTSLFRDMKRVITTLKMYCDVMHLTVVKVKITELEKQLNQLHITLNHNEQ
jgi:hypothetical protein